jgi:hypothetical protein
VGGGADVVIRRLLALALLAWAARWAVLEVAARLAGRPGRPPPPPPDPRRPPGYMPGPFDR